MQEEGGVNPFCIFFLFHLNMSFKYSKLSHVIRYNVINNLLHECSGDMKIYSLKKKIISLGPCPWEI